MTRHPLILLCCCALAGCGSRSALSLAQEDRDSAPSADQGAHRVVDAATFDDGRPWRPDISSWPDRSPRLDMLSPHSCLPLPTHEVEGSYWGSWDGTVTCTSFPPMAVSGELQLQVKQLVMGTPFGFEVFGEMSGIIGSFLTITSKIVGEMKCTELTADMPQMLVSASGMQLDLTGAMTGDLVAYGFEHGQWKAEGSDFGINCQAEGTWTAWK